MADPIEFYFDFSSPYGYLASTRIDELAARHRRDVQWRPILLGAIFKFTGAAPLPNIPIKGEYYKHDFPRTARLLSVPFKLPTAFPIASLAPSRAFYWLQEQNPQQAKELAKRLFKAFYVDDIDISKPENTLAIAAGIGLDRPALAAGIETPLIKERLKKEVQSAMDKGVFGSPYFIVDGEPFHGSDKMDQLDRWLATGGW
ncbi:MAG TPA: 2-hydroxychromene-2-carboxylate isomerase [Burkholderiales bacterium]|nr:2-hydroxychromene-2-carboxylate isomerase [Burkholderiales bacterium]